MIVYINLLIALAFSFVCLGLAKIIYGYAKINKRIDCLITNQHKIFKYHIVGILSQMRNSRTLAIMQEDYELANSIQENIKGIEEVLMDYE
jgi:hypothetical protein